MPSSLVQPLALKQQPKEYLAHLLIRRLGPKFGHGQGVRHGSQLVDFVIIWKLKADFHSVHRQRPGIAQAPLMVNHQPLVHRLNVFGRGCIKAFVRQVNGVVIKPITGFFVHSRIVRWVCRGGHSYFPRVAMEKIFASFVPETTGNSHVA